MMKDSMLTRLTHKMTIVLSILPLTMLLTQCAKQDKKDVSQEVQKPRKKIPRRRSRNAPRERTVTRGLKSFKEAGAEDKRYLADAYEAKGAPWYRGLTYDDLMKKYKQYEADKRWDLVVKYLDRLIKLTDDQKEIRHMRLKMADAMFDSGEYARASKLYRYFAELYPGSKQSEYAAYKALLAKSRMILAPDRDTTAAQDVVREGRDFLKRKAEGNDSFNKEVQELIDKAQQVLFKSEVITFYFYLNDNKFGSAEGRLKYIKEQFYDAVPELRPEIIVLEYEFAVAKKDKESASQKVKELKKNYPNYSAKGDSAKKSPVESENKKDYVAKF